MKRLGVLLLLSLVSIVSADTAYVCRASDSVDPFEDTKVNIINKILQGELTIYAPFRDASSRRREEVACKFSTKDERFKCRSGLTDTFSEDASMIYINSDDLPSSHPRTNRVGELFSKETSDKVKEIMTKMVSEIEMQLNNVELPKWLASYCKSVEF